MLDRLPVNGMAVPFKIRVVANPVWPVSALPMAALVSFHAAHVDRLSPTGIAREPQAWIQAQRVG